MFSAVLLPVAARVRFHFEPWLDVLFRALLDNGLLLTVVLNAIWLLACVLIYRGQKSWARSQSFCDWLTSFLTSPLPARHTGGADAPLLQGRCSSSYSGVSATAANYVRFLDTGFYLFMVLACIASVATAAVWDWRILWKGETIQSIQRTLFDISQDCVAGFPVVTSDNLAPCANETGPNHLEYFDPRWDLASPGQVDPRPAGFFMRAASLDTCKHVAMLCGGSVLTFGHADMTAVDAHGDKLGECWVFTGEMGEYLPYGNYTSCQGKTDLVPGFVEFGLTIVYGIVAFVYACRLLKGLTMSDKSMLESSTLWLTELPRADREDGEHFELELDDFHRVATDLRRELTKRVLKRLQEEDSFDTMAGKDEFEKEEKVLAVYILAAPRPKRRRKAQFERQPSFGDHSPHDGESPAPTVRVRSQLLAQAPDAKHKDAKPGVTRRLAGHAFAVMSREVYAALLLRKPGGNSFLSRTTLYSTLQAHTLFKFGMPPWSAVTLRCQRAPPASDIHWSNLYIGWRRIFFLTWIFKFLLFFFALCIVAPTSLANMLLQFTDALQQMNEADKSLTHYFPPSFWSTLRQLAASTPSYIMLFVNSVVLPLLIQLLYDGTTPHLRSASEEKQFSSNHFYMLLNAFIIPLMSFTSIDQPLWQQMSFFVDALRNVTTDDVVKTVGSRVRFGPSLLIQKYTANAAIISSACQLIQLGKGIGRRLICSPDEPWAFAWGYWYAWAMSVLFISLVLSVVMPTQLILAAFFFALTRRVHFTLLEDQVFDLAFDMDRDFEIKITCMVFRAIGFFWAFMALFFFSEPVGPHSLIVKVWVASAPDVSWMQIFTTPLFWPVPLVHFVCFVLPAAGFWLVSGLFDHMGSLEKWAFRQLGERWPSTLVRSLRITSVVVVCSGAVLCFPRLEWQQQELPAQVGASGVLCCLSVLVFLIGGCVEWVARMRARGRALRDVGQALEYSERVSLHRLLEEKGMEDVRRGYWLFNREAENFATWPGILHTI